MSVSYLPKKWAEITREERYYTMALSEYAQKDQLKFMNWIIEETGLKLDSDNWDIGIEVCLYRDFLWYTDKFIGPTDYSPKRTFDLCLFHEKAIIVVEAKVYGRFDSKQLVGFTKDPANIRKLFNLPPEFPVYFVALASSYYFANQKKYGNKELLALFNNFHLTWRRASEIFEESRFVRANDLYLRML